MKLIFNSGTSYVLLNGVSGKTIHCRRGVRQGDPLSPLLFVITADLLQSVLNYEKSMGHLQLPISLNHTNDFPVVQYADDTLIFMEADPVQLTHLKAILQSFSSSTCLSVNYSKSMLVPINLDPDRTQFLAQTFGCSIGSLPFSYLGLPLDISKPKVADFLPLVSRCERRLNATSALLSQAGRLEITNANFFLLCPCTI